MALFDENVTFTPARRRPMSRGMVAGIWALVIALAVLLVITFLPTSYVIQRPGPVYNTLGTVEVADGTQVPLIAVEGAETFPTDGALDLLTIQVVGNPERTPSWFELATAWFDPSRAVLPIEAVFREDQTSEERNEESAAMMVDSQKEATAAALTEFGYDIDAKLAVHSFTPDSASAGVLEEGDVILSADGTPVTEIAPLREIVNDGQGAPIELVIERDGEEETVSITPKETEVDGETTWLIGVNLTNDFEFPIDVTIQLNNVGGPSAGMMFALGIIDTLTPGRAQRRRDRRGHRDDLGGRPSRSDRRHPSEAVGGPRRGRRLVPRPGGELRRGRRPRSRRAARVLGRNARRRHRRARRDPRGRRPGCAAHLYFLSRLPNRSSEGSADFVEHGLVTVRPERTASWPGLRREFAVRGIRPEPRT